MEISEIIDSLEDQARDKESMINEEDPEDIFRGDVLALRAAAELLRKVEENKPLTIEQIREMDGEPVWVVELNGYPPHWALIHWHRKRNIFYLLEPNGAMLCAETFILHSGKVYRRRQEGD